MSRVRGIIFDLFDTLVDLHFSRLPGGTTLTDQHQIVVERGHGLDFETFAAILKESDRSFYGTHFAKGLEVPTLVRFTRAIEKMGIEDDELAHRLTRAHMGKIQDVAEAPTHHADVLQALARRYRLGLCSNFSYSPTALSILEHASMRSHFHALVVSDEVGIRKPRPEIFQSALDALGVSASEAVHVGDNLDADIGGAGALGIRTIWLRRRVRDPQRSLSEYEGPPPTWVIDDLSEIEALLDASSEKQAG